MKKNKKASILLWAIMLSLIISISFIAISTQINKNIKLSGNISSFADFLNKYNIFISKKESNNLGNHKFIIFNDNKSSLFGMKNKQEKNFIFSGSSDFSISISKVIGANIYFEYYKNNTLTNSGIVADTLTFTGELDSTNHSGTLNIKNLGGYSSILLNTEISFLLDNPKYKIINKIGNNFFIEFKN